MAGGEGGEWTRGGPGGGGRGEKHTCLEKYTQKVDPPPLRGKGLWGKRANVEVYSRGWGVVTEMKGGGRDIKRAHADFGGGLGGVFVFPIPIPFPLPPLFLLDHSVGTELMRVA